MAALLILNYHRLTQPGDRSDPRYYNFTLDRAVFRQQMTIIARLHLPVVDLGQPLPNSETSPLSLALTFDDGHRSDLEIASPILSEFGYPATFFPVTAHTGQEGYLNWGELRQLSQAGFRIGSHSHTHANLTRLSSEALNRELDQARQLLREKLATEISLFSLPYGRHSPVVLAAVRAAGYRHALSTSFGLNTLPAADFLLNRWNVKRSLRLNDFASVLRQRPWPWLRQSLLSTLGQSLRRIQDAI